MKRSFWYILISYFIALISSVPGIIFGKTLIDNSIVLGSLIFVTVLPLILFVYNIISAKIIIKKINNSNIAKMNAFLVSHRDDAEKTEKLKLKELQKIHRRTFAYTALIGIIAFLISSFAGILLYSAPPLSIYLFICSSFLFFSVLHRIPRKPKIELGDDAAIISENDYPKIYSLAYKAAKSVGSEGNVIIHLNWTCSAGVVKDDKNIYIQLGVILLCVLSEEELYSIFLHEFSHISKENEQSIRERQYNSWLAESGEDDLLTKIMSNLYLRSTFNYIFNYMIYEYASSVVAELRADKAMVRYSDAKIATSALLKTHYDNMFYWESCVKNENSLYESEKLEANYLTKRIELFKKAIYERKEFWNELIKKEIIANNSTHPTLKMRMDAFGITDADIIELNSTAEYLEETKRVLELAEGKIYDELSKTFSKDREERYLKPLKRIEEWERCGRPIIAENYADIIADYKTLGKHEEAEAVCDMAIEKLPTHSAAYAIFMKGSAMLYRYDENGIDMIYKAMEQNGNCVDSGLDIIGNFCCITGRQEELEKYRSRAAQIAQKHRDEDFQISFLSKRDKLTKDTLPDGLLQEILTYISSIDNGIIENIYLVRKTVSESFFSSVFIIHFYGGTDAQRNEIMHKIFCYLDSHPSEWQFSLFDYFDYPEINVEKIEGSLVFSKNNKK